MSDDPKEPTNRTSMTGIGLALGAGIGVALGTAFGDVGMGVSLGAGLGLVVGACLDVQGNKRAD